MTDKRSGFSVKSNTQILWAKYEDIAMHFNDLLMRLRSQSLAGIAAIATAVGIFAKSGVGNSRASWLIAAGIFTAAGMFWVAIWFLDFMYYNRLLLGAVSALRELEKETQVGNVPIGINMSTLIEAEFKRPLTLDDYRRFLGVMTFYLIVLAAIAFGAAISIFMYLHTPLTAINQSNDI